MLIEHMPVADRFRRIVDLGCGNGVLGIVAAAFNPHASLLFRDESYMAVASASANFGHAFAQTRDAEFSVNDCLNGVAAESQDLVLVNPPYHQQHSVGDALAWRMFKDARRVLRQDGELRIVGNRHLGYHAKLRKLFGNCETIASDSKFVVLGSIKT
jgi:16S rRNA (guanine1207-N2)-methyltransferase